MLYTADQLQTFSKNLLQEINKKGNNNSSIAYIKNPIPKTKLVQDGEKYQVIMIGGTHLESAIVSNNKGIIKVHDLVETNIPKIETKKQFLDYFAQYVSPEIKVLAINFAYPIKPVLRDGKLDAILLSVSKEHKFEGLIGKKVGLEVENFLSQKNGQKVNVSICNDTTALGLAGLSFENNFDIKNVSATVIGTGFNIGTFVNSEMFINLEAGNFDKFEQSESGRHIDKNSQNPGKQQLEKELSGGYLVSHFNYYAKKEGLEIQVESTKEVSQIATTRHAAGKIARKVIERSAQMSAMSFKTLFDLDRDQDGKSADQLILVEGSLYWKGYNYIEYLNKWLKELDVEVYNSVMYQDLLEAEKKLKINGSKTHDRLVIGTLDKIGIIGAAKMV